MQTTGSCMQFLLLPLVEAEPQPKPQPKPEPTGERAPLLGGARSDGDMYIHVCVRLRFGGRRGEKSARRVEIGRGRRAACAAAPAHICGGPSARVCRWGGGGIGMKRCVE